MLAELAADLRPEDVREIRLSNGHTPAEALQAGLDVSAWVYCVVGEDLEPLGAFGLAGAPGARVCAPWALASPKLRAADWGRWSRPVVHCMRRGVELLENWVHVDNIRSVRWLKACGFTLEEPEPYGVQGALFHRFWMRGDLCATR
jgi:hypothetical protein